VIPFKSLVLSTICATCHNMAEVSKALKCFALILIQEQGQAR